MAPHEKPVLLYDGECRFCVRWVKRWRKTTGDAVDYLPYQEHAGAFPQTDRDECAHAAVLITPEGEKYAAAEAALRARAYGDKRTLLWMYKRVPGFARASEAVYRFIARNRSGLPPW